MSGSSIFGSPILLLSKSPLKLVNVQVQSPPASIGYYGGGLMIECSSRPKKKATAHHMKTRPKKTQPWDIKRKPTVYPPLPALPPDWTLVSSAGADNGGGVDGGSAGDIDSASTPALQAPAASE